MHQNNILLTGACFFFVVSWLGWWRALHPTRYSAGFRTKSMATISRRDVWIFTDALVIIFTNSYLSLSRNFARLGYQHYHNLSLRQFVQPRKHFLVQGRRRCWQQLVTRIRIRRAWGRRDPWETGPRSRRQWFSGGLHALALDCRRHGIWTGVFLARATERPLSQETDPDILGLPQQRGNVGCSGPALQ